MTTLTSEEKTNLENKNVFEIKELVERDYNKIISDLIPLRFLKVKIDDIPKDLLKKLNDDKKQGVYIYGAAGVGKTHLGYSIILKYLSHTANNYLKKIDNDYEKYKTDWANRDDDSRLFAITNGFNLYRPNYYPLTTPIKMFNFPSMLQTIKNSYENELTMSIEDFNEKILIVDDLGAEKFTDWSIENLYRLVNYRYENMLTTVFISNLSLKELSQRVGDRIVSRIIEMCHLFKVEGKDRRLN